MLTGKGVTAWRRALTRLTCSPAAGQAPPAAARTPPAPLPGSVAAELVHVLAAIAVALAGT